jgi:hypothetical protein
MWPGVAHSQAGVRLALICTATSYWHSLETSMPCSFSIQHPADGVFAPGYLVIVSQAWLGSHWR